MASFKKPKENTKLTENKAKQNIFRKTKCG